MLNSLRKFAFSSLKLSADSFFFTKTRVRNVAVYEESKHHQRINRTGCACRLSPITGLREQCCMLVSPRAGGLRADTVA